MSVLSDLVEQRNKQSTQPRAAQRVTRRLVMVLEYGLLIAAGVAAVYNYHSITAGLSELLAMWL